MSEEPDSAAFADRLAELAAAARASTEPAMRAEFFTQVQRASGWALRAAIAEAREARHSWRDLAERVGIPPATLHRQFAGGGNLQIARPGEGPPPETGQAAPVPVARELPAPLDRFVGRTDELTRVRRLLTANRLVTVTGPGGAGKSRLALEAARRAGTAYPDGIFFVELASIRDPALITEVIAAAAGVPERPGAELADTLADAFGVRRILLLVDNCEHLVRGCGPLLETLLHRCPRLAVLATSQEALGIPGEATCPIGTLGLPPHTGDRRSALRSDAVRLFVERARAVLPAFELTDELTPMVVRICTRLDGLPLALELAARWLRTISPDRLLAVLDGGGLVDAPSSAELRRDTSIRASVAWSHALATPAERVVLRRLSVFSGAFDSDAASAVCGEDAEQAIAGLAAKSLLIPAGTGRFRLLEPVRRFAAEQLVAAGEDVTTHDRLLELLVRLASPLVTDLHLPAELRARLTAERDTLAQAVDSALKCSDERAVLLAVALARVWRESGYPARAIQLIEQVLDRQAPTAHRVLASSEGALLLMRAGDPERAATLAGQAVALGRAEPDAAVLGRALGVRAGTAEALGDLASALEHRREQVAILRTAGEPRHTAAALNDLAWTATQAGDHDLAAQSLAEALPVLRADPHAPLFVTLHTRATLALVTGDIDSAERDLVEALGCPECPDDNVVYCAEGLAIVAARRDQADRALRLSGAAAGIRERCRIVPEPWWQNLVSEANDRASARLSRAAARSALAAGGRLDVTQAVAFALGMGGAPSPLTARELQVAELVAQGLGNALIARRLAISERTVVAHLGRIREKLGLPTRTQIAVWVTEQRA